MGAACTGRLALIPPPRRSNIMELVNELALPGTDVTATDLKQGSILFVGTATVILRYAGFTILTDPNFLHRGDHVHLGYGMTATRRTDPGSSWRRCRRSISSCSRTCTRTTSTARSSGSSTGACRSSPRLTPPPT